MLFLISPILYCLSSIYLFFVSYIQYPISCYKHTLLLILILRYFSLKTFYYIYSFLHLPFIFFVFIQYLTCFERNLFLLQVICFTYLVFYMLYTLPLQKGLIIFHLNEYGFALIK